MKRPELIDIFVKAINYAGKSAELGWIYGNNVIADFINRHNNDLILLSAIKQKASISTPFDYEQQLLISSKTNNPWALHALASHYIFMNKIKLALPLLETAVHLNYNRAYYTLSLITDNSDKAHKYLTQSSLLGYPNATYQLAMNELEKNNSDKFFELLLLAKQQNLAQPKIDLELQNDINKFLN